MKAYQKLGACALTALFMLLPCGCTDPKPTVTFTEYDEAALIGVVTEEEIDAELLARGYSNFFLEIRARIPSACSSMRARYIRRARRSAAKAGEWSKAIWKTCTSF